MFVPLSFDHSLRPFLPELARFQNTQELEQSKLYQKLKPSLEQILSQVWHEDLAKPPALSSTISAVAWNIERGIRFEGLIQCLREHPLLHSADVLLLSELDWGMARTGNRFVAREIAACLEMNYAFAPCYIALTKGAGVEKDVA